MFGPGSEGPWGRPAQGYGPPQGQMSPHHTTTGQGDQNSPQGERYSGPPPQHSLQGPPPPSAPNVHVAQGRPSPLHHNYSPSPGPSSALASSPPPPPAMGTSSGYHQPPPSYPGAPPGFVSGRPPPPGGYVGPPPTQYNGPPPSSANSSLLPPTGPAGMMSPGQYTGPPPMMAGTPGQAMGGPPPQFVPAAATSIGGVPAQTTIFVGTISGGVTDSWLKKLLEACGSLRSFKRVNASFGFAEFIDADSVLRALAVLPGQDLPAMGKSATDSSARKKLTVKADEKTRKYLDLYEQGRMRTQGDEDNEESARKMVKDILEQMLDPNHVEEADRASTNPSIPQHLKDLPPEELPEEHRGAVLSEIEKFRQASAARDEERKRIERIQEMERLRASDHAQRQQQQQQQRGGNDAYGSSGLLQANGRRTGADPQSFSRPVSFVPGGAGRDESSLQPDERDAREEERRVQHERDNAARAAQEAERRYQSQERSRLAHWDRELGIEDEKNERQKRNAASQRRLYEEWDQARESERDLYHIDRSRWRTQRQQQREREEREDDADRKAQAEEEERAREETERFLAQQAEDMAAFEREQRAAGVLMPGAGGEHAPLKLKRLAPAEGPDAPATNQSGPHAAQREGLSTHMQQPTGILGTLDDDSELSGIRRGKLGHIDLTDTSDVAAMRERMRSNLPSDRSELLGKAPMWEKLPTDAIDTRYREILDKGLIASLGESVPDMVDEILAKVRAHSSATDMIEVIEPVLEDEAAPLIATLWTELLVDTLAGPPLH